MKAFIIDRYGKADVVRAGEMPEPELGADDVLVQIHAASVNPLDLKIRDGEFKLLLPYRMPLILGNDMAGVVVRVGAGVRRFNVGDEVYARPDDNRIGTFAEYIAIKEDALALKPKTLTMEQAAAMPLVALTAWQALVEKGHLKKGQKVLIHAGTGGVGTVAIQLAKHLGATVATTASVANAAMLKQLGADIVIDYKKDDFSLRLRDYDLVLDSQGGVTQKKSLGVLKPGGKVVGIAGPPDPDFAKARGLNALVGLVMRMLSYGIRSKARAAGVSYSFLYMRASGEQLRQLAELVDAGAIRPVIDRVYPFAQTMEALAYVETGRSKGKVVIKVR
ncbi:NADP-dependent oxidoreductase [Oxalobacteraceae bacterium OTU3CINTB1]|nr:NADP-dependent oxidoreductase [Oxalobacteraceae bacterium OTU3CINTB1]